MKTDNRARRRALLTSAAAPAIALALMATAAQAQEVAKTFAIAPQPLADALLQLSRQADIDIVASTDLTRGRVAPKVAGEMTTADAMSALLAGSGLTAAPSGAGYVITRASDPQSGSAAGDGADSGTVQALIVTAQKREENIQDVPIAMSAFSQEALERSQIAGGPDLITQVPNMTFTKTNFSSYSIQLRGIGTQAISATTDPGVAVAFNNTPFIQNRFFEQEFYDLQRVEVLRGPQGTLYGRNATAGVVNIISQKPKFTAESKLSGDVANYSSTRLEGMVNIPLVEDKVALRLAGAWTKRKGYSTNELTGSAIDGRDLWSTRASLRFAPTDKLDVNLIWEHFQEDDDRLRSGKQLCKRDVVTELNGHSIPYDYPLLDAGAPAKFGTAQALLSQGCTRVSLYSPEAFQTPNGPMIPYYVPLWSIGLPATRFDPYVSTTQSPDLRVIESTVDPEYRAKADLGELQISWDLNDNLTLNSETAYSADFVWSKQDFNRFNTLPGAWVDVNNLSQYEQSLIDKGILRTDGAFCDPQLGCSDRMVAVDVATAKSRQFNQEFRLSSDFDGPFNFSLGANFTRFDLEAKYYVFVNSLTLSRVPDLSGSFANGIVPWQPGVSDNRQCMETGLRPVTPAGLTGTGNYAYTCVYIEPNPIDAIQDTGHNYFLSKNPYRLISYAAFGEAYYNITDNLKVTAGLRWTVDQKRAPRIPSALLAGDSYGLTTFEIIDQEWREPTGRLALDWKPDLAFTDQTLLYASYAHGYKAGGANPPPYIEIGVGAHQYGAIPPSETRPRTFEAEFVNAYELGAKNTLLDGRMTLNLAGFYYDYKNYQISEIVDRSAFNRNFDATVWGLEIESDWRPLENLKFGFKGGYENTRIADGEQAIDLMDRTAGTPGWTIVRPFPTFPSSCVLPEYLFTHGGMGSAGGGGPGGCELAYFKGVDPHTGLTYVPYPTQVSGTGNTLSFWPAGTYPGFDPLAGTPGDPYTGQNTFNGVDYGPAPNNGEGFFKQLGGNQLPNAPRFTGTVTVDYTLPLPHDWLMTLHTDLYAQSNAWWRVFNDNAFDKLHPYFTMNLAAIFTNEDAGWKVMAYVKNVLDRDSITGAFLNSDDTALTTNVFLTEPRLYGLRVTKEWTGAPLFGSLGGRHEGPYPFTVELGGQVQRHDAPYDPIRPSFIDQFSPAIDPTGVVQKGNLDWGDGREVKLTWRSDGPWQVAAGVRFGKTNHGRVRSHLEEMGNTACAWTPYDFYGLGALFCDPTSPYYDPTGSIRRATNWSDANATGREEHTLVDFMVGRDLGLGVLGKSTIAGGLRYAQFKSKTDLWMEGIPYWDLQEGGLSKYVTENLDASTTHLASLRAEREFKGLGPMLSWDAAARLLGNEDVGHLDIDWSIGGGALFGKQKTSLTGYESADPFTGFAGGGTDELGGLQFVRDARDAIVTPISRSRSQSVTVPVIDLSLGLSYSIDRVSIGAGYRWERYFDVLDAGDDEHKSYDRTIDGPYMKISVGFGG
jgi:outer membrane receptor protein involved in Fe transport